MPIQTQQKKAYIYALLAVLCWSSVATAFKISLSFMSPFYLVFLASFTSFLILLFFMFYFKKWQTLLKLSKSELGICLILGFINPFAYYLILFKAYSLLLAQEAQAINYTWALALSYLSVFILKQKLVLGDVISGIICYFGVFIIATKGDLLGFEFASLDGIFFALASTLLWALYWVFLTKIKTDAIVSLFLNFSIGVLLLILWWIFFEKLEFIELKGIFGAVYVGAFEMGFTFILWQKAMSYTQNTAKIANLIFISPFLSLIFISFILKEQIYYSTIIGLCLIIFGLLFQKYYKKS